MKYLVSHSGVELGPQSIDEIVTKVRAKELELFDYVFDEQKSDWVLLMEFAPLAERLKSNKPPRPHAEGMSSAPAPQAPSPAPQAPAAQSAPQAQAAQKVEPVSAHTITEWYILKGENRFGPFSYTDLVKMQQQKVVFPFDFIWHASLDGWKRLAEIEDFQSETIRNLHAKTPNQQAVFAERKFKRQAFAGKVIVHDNLSLWKGEGFEISKGGVGISMSNSVVAPGQHLFVHFKKHEEWPAFNAVCEVVSKKFVNGDSPVQYGLRFLSLSQDVQEEFYRKVA